MNIPATDTGTQKTLQFWDRFANTFDLMTRCSEWRWGGVKRGLFSKAYGNIVMVGAGTGRDFPYFPQNVHITALDFSPKMLERAKDRVPESPADITLVKEDVQFLSFPDNFFDSCITSCVFCSVANPVRGLEEVYRVLKPGGRLFMFEHTMSQNFLFKIMLTLMNFMPGPDLTRDTVQNVRTAGFTILDISYVFQDIVKTIEAKKG